MATSTVTAADVRAWAQNEGLEVGTRGVLPSDIVEAYNKGRRGAKRYTPVASAS